MFIAAELFQKFILKDFFWSLPFDTNDISSYKNKIKTFFFFFVWEITALGEYNVASGFCNVDWNVIL